MFETRETQSDIASLKLCHCETQREERRILTPTLTSFVVKLSEVSQQAFLTCVHFLENTTQISWHRSISNNVLNALSWMLLLWQRNAVYKQEARCLRHCGISIALWCLASMSPPVLLRETDRCPAVVLWWVAPDTLGVAFSSVQVFDQHVQKNALQARFGSFLEFSQTGKFSELHFNQCDSTCRFGILF